MKYSSAIIKALLALTLGVTCSLTGADAKSPPLFWPDTKLIPVQVSHNTAIFDGLEFEMVEFMNSALPMYSPSMRLWQRDDGLWYRSASAAFSHRRDPTIKTGISIVRTQDWLGEVTPDSLDRYIASLKNLHKNRFTLLDEDNRFAPIRGSGYLVGHPYKLVHFKIQPEEEDRQAIEIWDFITQHEDYTVVFSFECPEDLADRNFDTASMLMTSLSRMDELE